MPSSLAAALAASKKGAAASQTKEDAPLKHSAPSSLAQHQKNHNDDKPVYAQSGKSKRQTAEQASRKGRGGRGPPKSRQHQENNRDADEIVFICDIPSSDDDECDEDGGIGLDTLQISDHQESGRGHGGRKQSPKHKGGRGREGGRRDTTSKNNNGGRVLNVNASRRMIGHALGTRLGPPPNNSRDINNTKHNNYQASSNPGSMPTPWSKKAQELKNDNGDYCTERKTDPGGKREKNISNQRDSRVNHPCETSVNDKLSKSNMQEPVPKLESAKIKGRWADEDSSDDE